MFIVLPPSETKTHGGDGSPLNFAELSFPELTPIRKSIAADLQALPVDAAVDALGLSEKNRAEAHANTQLFSCLLYTSPSPRDQRGSRMPSSA